MRVTDVWISPLARPIYAQMDVPVVCCGGGPSQEQKDLAASQAAFYKNLQAQQNQQFAQQSKLLEELNAVWGPIFQAGPSQTGMSAAQETALRSQATEGTGAEYAKAARAVNENLAARGGGNVVVPSGADTVIRGKIATAAAADQASKNLAITDENYALGRQNWLAAASGLSGATLSAYNPTGYAGAATTAGNSAFNSATTIYNERKAASPWGAIGGLVGGLAGSFLGPVGAALGSKVGGWIGGAAGGGGGAPSGAGWGTYGGGDDSGGE